MKGKVDPVHVIKAYRGNKVELHSFVTLALDGGEWSTSQAAAIFAPKKKGGILWRTCSCSWSCYGASKLQVTVGIIPCYNRYVGFTQSRHCLKTETVYVHKNIWPSDLKVITTNYQDVKKFIFNYMQTVWFPVFRKFNYAGYQNSVNCNDATINFKKLLSKPLNDGHSICQTFGGLSAPPTSTRLVYFPQHQD